MGPKDKLRDPVARLEESQLAVEPGTEVRTSVTVYNASALVDELTFTVLGPAADFAQVVPDRVSLMPGDESSAELVFTPGASTPAGTLPFGVRVASGVDEQFATVVEGELEVGAVHALDARLVGVTPQGRWVGRYRAAFTNRGTAPVTLDLAIVNQTEDLGFALAPQQLELDRGATGEAFIKVRPVSPFFLGQPRRHSFQLAYRRDSDDADQDPTARGTLQGDFEQRPVGSRRALVGGALVAAGVAAAIAFWPRPAPAAEPEVPPPPPELREVSATGSDTIEVAWAGNPLATGYRVELVREGEGSGPDVIDSVEVPGERTVYSWPELEPVTEHCFRLVALNGAGTSEATEHQCARTLESQAPQTETPTVAETSDPDTDGESDQTEAPADGETEPGGAGGTTTPGPTEQQSPGGVDPTSEVQGFYVIYSAVPIDDPANESAAREHVAQLQAEGLDANLRDSRTSEVLEDGLRGLWVVYQDGFESHEQAIAHCNEHRDLAPNCFAPGAPGPTGG